MSGHSKWSQIKRQKGAADIKRGQVFTKLANMIVVAVRNGGGNTDAETNFKLRLAIEKARAANMPKENIERAIERGSQKSSDTSGLFEVTYEGYGPGKIAVVVEAVTDNKQRTTAEIKNYFEKNGGVFAGEGSVSYLFKPAGLLILRRGGDLLKIIDAGVQDIEELDETVEVYTAPGELFKIKQNLVDLGFTVESAELFLRPIAFVAIDNQETAQKAVQFVSGLENLDDVQKVFSNF